MILGPALDSVLAREELMGLIESSALRDKAAVCSRLSQLLENHGVLTLNSLAQYIQLLDMILEQDEEALALAFHLKMFWQPTSLVTAKEKVVDVFFVWIGCLGYRQLEYYEVWQRVCSGKTSIYYDSRYLLAGEIKPTFEQLFGGHFDSQQWITQQNHCLKRFLESGESNFDDFFIRYVRRYEPGLALGLEVQLASIKKRYQFIAQHTKLVDIAALSGVFNMNARSFEQYYQYELILRHNLAAASDIVRLLILYHQGGMYVDFDTLPCFEHCFKRTNQHYPHLVKRNMSQVVKSEIILDLLRKKQLLKWGRPRQGLALLDDVMRTFFSDQPQFLQSLLTDIEGLKSEQILPDFSLPSVYAHGLCLSAAKHAGGEFNNNVLIAHKHSKAVRIVLRTMMKRYTFIEQNGIVFGERLSQGQTNDEYWLRFNDYRRDHLKTENHVTLFLTGPSMILETMLSLCYEVLDIEMCSPSAVALALSHPQLGFSFHHQTQFTAEHMRSSWQQRNPHF
jgi:hypothetical protein